MGIVELAGWLRVCLLVQEIWAPSLGWEDPLDKGMAVHYSIVAWRIPWMEEPS